MLAVCKSNQRIPTTCGKEVEQLMAGRSPKVRRRRLGIELRQLREGAEYTIEQVAARLEVSDSKISRIEKGQVGATPRDVRDMAALYGVTGQRMENLMQLARETREKPWWKEYSDLHVDYAAFEAEASSMLMFAPMLIPGLLQTADYARAVLREIRFDLPPEKIERRVEFRLRRQRIFSEPNPPTLWTVMDEAILCRMIGGPRTMQEQLRKLIELARRPNVTLQLLPFSGGTHAGLDGPFYIMRFPEPTDRDTVYFEHWDGEHYLDHPEAVSQYLSLFDHIRAAALKPDDSIKLLVDRADELSDH
jgi:transcriptional regulator with XRE-family HTH domain